MPLYELTSVSGGYSNAEREVIYVIGFFYPVVPKGKARIRVQISAGPEPEHLQQAVAAFVKVGQRLGVIPVTEIIER